MTSSHGAPQRAGFHGVHRPADGEARATVVLLHGVADSGECWTPIADRLDRSYELLMPDAPGHGTAPLPEGAVDMATLVGEVIELLDARRSGSDDGDGRVVMVGHSMGAATAAHVAAQRPELVRGLVLEDPPWLAEPPASAERHHPDWLRELRDLDHEARVAAGRAGNPTWSDAELGPWSRSKEQIVLEFFDRYERGVMHRWRDLVGRLEVPTLLVTGDPRRGAIVTPDVAAHIAELAPDVRVLRLDGAGHSIRRDRPDAFVEAVTAFLSEVTS